jgi:hypothetical protein
MQIPKSEYVLASDRSFHVRAVQQIDETTKLLQSRVGNLSAMEQALTKYYVDDATRASNKVAAYAGSSQMIQTVYIEPLRASIQPIDLMNANIKAGKAPFEVMTMTVEVTSSPGAAPPMPMSVYVLPSKLFNSPDLFTPAEIRDFLEKLTFPKPTSPSEGVLAKLDMLVWVGPTNSFPEMTEMVLKKRINRYHSLASVEMLGAKPVLKLRAPDDLVKMDSK